MVHPEQERHAGYISKNYYSLLCKLPNKRKMRESKETYINKSGQKLFGVVAEIQKGTVMMTSYPEQGLSMRYQHQ